jgi:hypothetical protein
VWLELHLASAGRPHGCVQPAELPKRMTVGFNSIDAYARAGKIAECRSFLKDAYASDGLTLEYLNAQLRLHSRLSEFSEVLSIADELGRRFPDYPDHRYVLSAACAHLGIVQPILDLVDRVAGRWEKWPAMQVAAEALHTIGRDEQVIDLPGEYLPGKHHAMMVQMFRGQALMRHYGIASGLDMYTRTFSAPEGRAAVYRIEDKSIFDNYWYGQPDLPSRLRLVTRGGFGDYFMWQRYLPFLEAMGVDVIREDDPSPGLAYKPLPPQHDHSWLKTRLSKADLPEGAAHWTDPFALFSGLFPVLGYCGHDSGFLEAAPNPVAELHLQRIRGRAGGKPCVAVFWSANESESDMFGAKSLTLGEMLPLLSMPDIYWVVCQRGVQRDLWLASEGAGTAACLDATLTWDQTAAVIQGLDALVGMDSALVHLSAGMGKPTFMLLSSAADWRWERMPSSTPWYPALRLARAPVLGDWPAAVAQLQVLLKNWISANESR